MQVEDIGLSDIPYDQSQTAFVGLVKPDLVLGRAYAVRVPIPSRIVKDIVCFIVSAPYLLKLYYRLLGGDPSANSSLTHSAATLSSLYPKLLKRRVYLQMNQLNASRTIAPAVKKSYILKHTKSSILNPTCEGWDLLLSIVRSKTNFWRKI